MNLLTNDTAPYRGVRTGLQAAIAFVVGLILVVWNTPGVPENVATYLRPYELQTLLWLGIPTILGAGIMGYLTTLLREKVNQPVVTPPTEVVAETGTPSETPQA